MLPRGLLPRLYLYKFVFKKELTRANWGSLKIVWAYRSSILFSSKISFKGLTIKKSYKLFFDWFFFSTFCSLPNAYCTFEVGINSLLWILISNQFPILPFTSPTSLLQLYQHFYFIESNYYKFIIKYLPTQLNQRV